MKHATSCRDSGSCRRFCFKLKLEQETRPPNPLWHSTPTLSHTQTPTPTPTPTPHPSGVCGWCACVGVVDVCLLISSPLITALCLYYMYKTPAMEPTIPSLHLFTHQADAGPCALSLGLTNSNPATSDQHSVTSTAPIRVLVHCMSRLLSDTEPHIYLLFSGRVSE